MKRWNIWCEFEDGHGYFLMECDSEEDAMQTERELNAKAYDEFWEIPARYEAVYC